MKPSTVINSSGTIFAREKRSKLYEYSWASETRTVFFVAPRIREGDEAIPLLAHAHCVESELERKKETKKTTRIHRWRRRSSWLVIRMPNRAWWNFRKQSPSLVSTRLNLERTRENRTGHVLCRRAVAVGVGLHRAKATSFFFFTLVKSPHGERGCGGLVVSLIKKKKKNYKKFRTSCTIFYVRVSPVRCNRAGFFVDTRNIHGPNSESPRRTSSNIIVARRT